MPAACLIIVEVCVLVIPPGAGPLHPRLHDSSWAALGRSAGGGQVAAAAAGINYSTTTTHPITCNLRNLPRMSSITVSTENQSYVVMAFWNAVMNTVMHILQPHPPHHYWTLRTIVSFVMRPGKSSFATLYVWLWTICFQTLGEID